MVMRKERVSAVALLFFGAGFLLYALQYPLDSWASPGPAVFPLMAGGMLVIIAGYELARAFFRCAPTADAGSNVKRTSFLESMRAGSGRARVLLMVAVLIIYILMIGWLGFFVSNFCFVIVASRLTGARTWRAPVMLSLGINLFCYVLFELWLKLNFPRGILF